MPTRSSASTYLTRRFRLGVVARQVSDLPERSAVEADLIHTQDALRYERFRNLAHNMPQLAWIAGAGTDGQVTGSGVEAKQTFAPSGVECAIDVELFSNPNTTVP
jgi:hypothetical protein